MGKSLVSCFLWDTVYTRQRALDENKLYIDPAKNAGIQSLQSLYTCICDLARAYKLRTDCPFTALMG